MRVVARWGLAVVISAAVFVLSWWVCQGLAGLDESTALGVAGAALALTLAVMGWWAAREGPSADTGAGGPQAVPTVRAGRDVNVAGRDQTIINHRRGDA